MAENTERRGSVKKNVASTGTVPLTDVLFITLRRWWWIVISVALFVGGAYFYLLRTPSVYTRCAEILIKEEGKNLSLEAEIFSDKRLFRSKTNIENEINALQSNDVMEEVVRRLNLDVTYFRKGQFRNDIAYGYDLPVNVKFVNIPEDNFVTFDLTVGKNGNVEISDLDLGNDKKFDTVYKTRLNDTIDTPAGRMVVVPSPVYVKGEKVNLLVQKLPLGAVRGSFLGRLNVSVNGEKSSVVRLTLSDLSVQRADDVLNAVIAVYNENWIKDRNQISISTTNFIKERLGVIESELGNVDSDISSFKSANLIPDVEAASSMYMSRTQQSADQILNLNNQIQMAKYVRNYLTSDANRDQLLPANTGLMGGNIQGQIGEYNNKLLQRNSLLAKSSEVNPLVVALDEELAAQRNAMVKSIDNEMVALNTQLRTFKNTEAQAISHLASNPNQAKYLLSVERQQKVKESLYLYLLQKREENELNQAFTAYNTRVINSPTSAGVPPTPNRRNVLLLALLIGLALPFGATYGLEMMDNKVRGRKDVEDLTVPFVGEIPMNNSNREQHMFKKDVFKKAIVVKAGKRDVINEAFRVVRTNLEFMKINKDEADVVAVTSFNPGSGKSFITMNMATALALKGKKVLVIDGDLRHGSSSTYIGSPESGLADYLGGTTDNLASLIHQNEELPSLYVLPTGSMPPNPTELVETKRFGEMIAEMRKDFDYILIDCPPIEVVADAQIIDKLADRTLFVIRVGLLERTMLPQLEKIYSEKKFKNMAVVLNGTEVASRRYGYSHGYRYGYGYGYAYGKSYATATAGK